MSGTTEAFARVKIDSLLKDAGWYLSGGVSVLYEHSLRDGTLADYVLCDRSGQLDRDCIVEDVKVGRTAQTEFLFLQYMLNHLRESGRCCGVVLGGVLFGSTGAHRELRRRQVGKNTVEAVLLLPSGTFNLHSGVETRAGAVDAPLAPPTQN